MPVPAAGVSVSVQTETGKGDTVKLDDRAKGEVYVCFEGPLGAHLKKEVKERIWKDEYVEIFSLLPLEKFNLDKGKKDDSKKEEEEKRRWRLIPQTFVNWQQAFAILASVIGEKFPENCSGLFCYLDAIGEAHRTYEGQAWLRYDEQFRQRKAVRPEIRWDQKDIGLWLKVMAPEVGLEEVVTERTTPVHTTTPTEATHKDSTSDSWLDLHPHATEFFTTTTSTTAPAEISEPDSTAALVTEENSHEEDGDVASSSSENVCEGDVSHVDKQAFEKAMNAFGIDLLKQVHQESNNPNVVVSPFSIALGLLQLALGAENQTERKILETLHVESLQCLHEKLQKVTKRLVQTSLNVATRMYVKKDFHIKKNFLKRSGRLYGTKPVNLKPNMQQNVEVINKWVKDATRGKITNFLSSIPADIVLMLLNAIHFKGIWRNRFDPANTISDAFSISDDETVFVDMMQSNKYPLSYFTSDRLESQAYNAIKVTV
ncbi:unnamed protein product [Ranitomeya imitator]|uniref:Serpin domain-containing protein n=1 Tax=Ranitomeya imitator TaxID=111125 RepID=A0ABN9LMS3_9NEOB|nr:unnamed protein product [Ranitomeya imitator]